MWAPYFEQIKFLAARNIALYYKLFSVKKNAALVYGEPLRIRARSGSSVPGMLVALTVSASQVPDALGQRQDKEFKPILN